MQQQQQHAEPDSKLNWCNDSNLGCLPALCMPSSHPCHSSDEASSDATHYDSMQVQQHLGPEPCSSSQGKCRVSCISAALLLDLQHILTLNTLCYGMQLQHHQGL
jgi:hypothetical protein